MMDINEEHINESSILSYLQGEDLSDDVSSSIERWLNEGKNKQEARRIYQRWELSLLASEKPVDLIEGFNSIKDKIGLKNQTPVRNINRISNIWYAVAASVAILFTVLYIFNIDNEKSVKLATIESSNPKEFLKETRIELSILKEKVFSKLPMMYLNHSS